MASRGRSSALDAASKQFARRILADSDSDDEFSGAIKRTGSAERKASARLVAGLAEQALDVSGGSPRMNRGSPPRATRSQPKRVSAHAVYRSVSPSKPRTWQESLRHDDSPVNSKRWSAREGSLRDSGSWTSRNSMASASEPAAHKASSGWEGRWTAEFEARVPSPGASRAPVPLTSSKPHVTIPPGGLAQPHHGGAPRSAVSLSSLAVLADSPLFLSSGTTPVDQPSSRASSPGKRSDLAAARPEAQPAAAEPAGVDLKSMWARPGAPRAGSAGRCMWVVAHAEPEEGYGEGDAPVSFRGMQHAMECGVHLREHRVARVLCGPSLAEVQTAQYLAWCVGASVCIEAGLAEAGGCLRGPTPSTRQRSAYHPSVDAAYQPCTQEAVDEETFIECLPRAVDAAWRVADTVGVGECVVVVACPAIATAMASALAAGCMVSSDQSRAGQLRRNLSSIAPVPPCGAFKVLQPVSSRGSWLCDLSCARDFLTSPSAPAASFEILLAGETREWLRLWDSLRKLHRACADRARRSGGSTPRKEAKLRADVALHAMHMARDALPGLLHT